MRAIFHLFGVFCLGGEILSHPGTNPVTTPVDQAGTGYATLYLLGEGIGRGEGIQSVPLFPHPRTRSLDKASGLCYYFVNLIVTGFDREE